MNVLKTVSTIRPVLSSLILELNVSGLQTPQTTKARFQFRAGLVVLKELVKCNYNWLLLLSISRQYPLQDTFHTRSLFIFTLLEY
jgi:hypothetical protein